MELLPEEVNSFLSAHAVAALATVPPDSDYPSVVPVFYVARQGRVYFISHRDNKKVKNIGTHPHVGMLVTDITNLSSLELRGDAAAGEKNDEIMQQILEVSGVKSENAFPPVLQITDGVMVVVAVTITWYRLSLYSGTAPVFHEGTLE